MTKKNSEKLVGITSPALGALIDYLNKGRSLDFPMALEGQSVLFGAQSTSAQEVDLPFQRGDLETSTPIAELERRLYKLKRDWLTWQEEQGIHTVYLAVGLLKWKDAQFSQEEYFAPVVLYPVGLERKSRDKPYSLIPVEEDSVVNPALKHKLNTDFGITLQELPEEFNGATVEQYLADLGTKVKDLGWQVDSEVRLGRFTYEKFVMYNDLEGLREDACRNPIIRALSKAPLDSDGSEPVEIPHNIDEVVNPRTVFPVLDADSSQTEVMLRAGAGQNLVVQGPPGTGKSQTIANLVAQSLRDGKKILFVSEKIAALEVVNRRLNESGLSFACLEIHSHKSDKVTVVQELARTLRSVSVSSPDRDAEAKYEKLISLRDRLNNYVTELHRVRGGMQLSTFQVHARLARALGAKVMSFDLPIRSALGTKREEFDKVAGAIRQLVQIGNVFDHLHEHPWYGVEIATGKSDLLLADEVSLATSSLLTELKAFANEQMKAAATIGLVAPSNLGQTRARISLLEALEHPMPIEPSWTALSQESVAGYLAKVHAWQTYSQTIKNHAEAVARGFGDDFFALPVSEMSGRFARTYNTPLRFLKSNYRRDIAVLRARWLQRSKIGYSEAKEWLAAAASVVEARAALKRSGPEASRLFGNHYKGEETDWGSIAAGLEWLAQILKFSNTSELTGQLKALVLDPPTLAEYAKDAKAVTETRSNRVNGLVDRLTTLVNNWRMEGVSPRTSEYVALEKWLQPKSNKADLQDWLQYQRAIGNCKAAGLQGFVRTAVENGIPAKELEITFLQRFWKNWLAESYGEAPILADFSSKSQDDVVQQFRVLDDELKDVTITVIRKKIFDSQPKAESAVARESQKGVILREAQKKRRIKPLRKIFAEAPQLIQALKPCLLMSPLSVASYLGSSPFRFDLVVFDEASQIPPADAIGSILRGSQLIVAGDDKQLPPTRFFQADSEYDEEEEESEPLESVLDECLALPKFTRAPLKWHYRSRREELIDFSNKNFYDGELVTFPSPFSSQGPPAIEFRHVKDGVYDRGGSRKNRKEAEAVVDLIEEHLRNRPGSSLGVITLGMSQEDALLDAWEQRKILKPDLEGISEADDKEPFFIKALERVQGDERAFIILSLGYGPDTKGIISMNFGPINKNGGERRLNVAVTRAREKMILVSSILPHQIDLARLTTGSKGVAVLQQYLQYAYDGGHFPTKTSGTGEPESEFEEDVKERLEARGLKVDAQVGCSGFRLDLAIRHSKEPSRYILGVECDGATYHSQRSARDRDRLRQQVLEELGWNIKRIWSTDWVKTPDRIADEIVQAVRDLEIRPVDILPPVVTEEQSKVVERTEGVEPRTNNVGLATETPTPNPPAPDGNSYGFQVYKQISARQVRPNDQIYWAASYDKYFRVLLDDIKVIVNVESPVHVEAVMRRIASIYGIGRIGSRTRPTIEKAIRAGSNSRMFQQKGEFLWNGKPAEVRIPGPGTEPRKIEEVAPDEITKALVQIVRQEIGISRSSLVSTTARALGYGRMGGRVAESIEEGLDELLGKQTLTTYGDQILIKPDG